MSARLDFLNNTVRGFSHNHAAATTNNTAGASVDVRNAENPLTAVQNIFGPAGALSVQTKFQESTDGTTWADITGASIAAATTTSVTNITFCHQSNYVRSLAAYATSSSCSFSTLILGPKKQDP